MFGDKTYARVETVKRKNNGGGPIFEGQYSMTAEGAINKTFVLVGILLFTFLFGFYTPNFLYISGGGIIAFIIYLVTSLKPHLAPMTAPVYAIVQGLFVGSVSAIYAGQYSGIVLQAFSLTIACLLMMMIIYKSGVIEVNAKFRMGVSMAVGAVMITYIISLVGYYVGFQVPYLHEGGMVGIGITSVIIVIACMNLLLDFDNFDKGEAQEMPKYMEWYFGMGLLFTLIWLYVEILRLLSKIRD